MPEIEAGKNMKLSIGSYECGGRHGENTPLLLETIFYDGQNLVIDHQLGTIDREKALRQIRLAQESSEKFHVPVALDITASTPAAMISYIDFISENSDLPFVLDSSDPAPRLAGLKHCHKHNLLNRAIYNSITRDYAMEEIEALASYPPAGIILLAIDEEDYSPRGTINLLGKLIPSLYAHSITNLMVDVCVLDQVSLKCATEIARAVKNEYGLPVGGAPCNGIYMWDKLKQLPARLFEMALATAVACSIAGGFDFAFGGPVKTVEKTALSVAVASVYDRYFLQQGGLSLKKEHPINLLL